jgi:flagellar biosynthetic protein FliQ
MTPLEIIDISRDALWVLLKISAPAMLAALIVGLIIALFQALTQIQEMTLTFVPKIVAIFFTLMLALPFMFEALENFNQELMTRIADPERIADIPINTEEQKSE